MEFENKDNQKNSNNDIWWILAGLAILYLLFKKPQPTAQLSNQSSIQPTPTNQYNQEYQPLSTYENAEEWEIVRGEDGHISNLKVGRNATVGNSANSYNSHEKVTISGLTESDIDSKIKEMMQKNMQEMSKYSQRFVKLNDDQRKKRFGFS